MIFKRKDNLDKTLIVELKNFTFDIIGCIMEVTKELPCALPEYIYQEALNKVLFEHNINAQKEFIFHPSFHGEQMNAFFRMDFMIEKNDKNIIIECKAIEKITKNERIQLFSYLIGTGFPIGILVNFAHYPHPYIEKYYFDKSDMTITNF